MRGIPVSGCVVCPHHAFVINEVEGRVAFRCQSAQRDIANGNLDEPMRLHIVPEWCPLPEIVVVQSL